MHTHKELLGMLFMLNQAVREIDHYRGRITAIKAREADIQAALREAEEAFAACGPDEIDRRMARFEVEIAENEARHHREMMRRDIESEQYFIDDYEKEAQVIRGKLPARALELFEKLSAVMPGDVMSYPKNGACVKCGSALDDAISRRLEAIMDITQCPHCERILES